MRKRKPLDYYLSLKYPVLLVAEPEGGYTALHPDLVVDGAQGRRGRCPEDPAVRPAVRPAAAAAAAAAALRLLLHLLGHVRVDAGRSAEPDHAPRVVGDAPAPRGPRVEEREAAAAAMRRPA